MFDKLKSLLSDWKVSVALVGGAIVVATTFGTCTFEPGEAEAEDVDESSESVGEESSTEEGTTDENEMTLESTEAGTEEEASTETNNTTETNTTTE